jgi:hypothetical protein
MLAVAGWLALAGGCALFGGGESSSKMTIEEPTFSQYHRDGFCFDAIGRVLVLPLLNESPYTRAADEIGRALTAELQELGRFEVVAGQSDEYAHLARQVHRSGRFNEALMQDMADDSRADVILHGTVTHYTPYPRPQMGLVLQAVSPQDARVVASVDGIWDTTQIAVANRLRAYYRQKPERVPWVHNNIIATDDVFASELALDSPMLFQRFVCHEAVLVLTRGPFPPRPPVTSKILPGHKLLSPPLPPGSSAGAIATPSAP